MSKSRYSFSIQVLQILDGILVIVAFLVAMILWNSLGSYLIAHLNWAAGLGAQGSNYISLGVISPVLYIAVPCVPLA